MVAFGEEMSYGCMIMMYEYERSGDSGVWRVIRERCFLSMERTGHEALPNR